MAETFECDFADGPMRGRRGLPLPIEQAPSAVRFEITKDLKPFTGAGEPDGFVEYEKRLDDGTWRYFQARTEVSPEAARWMRDQVKNKNALSMYMTEQLVSELANRERFAGVIIYAREAVTGDEIPPGSGIGVVPTKFFKTAECALPLMQIVVDALKKKRGGPNDAPAIGDAPQPVFEVDGLKTLPINVAMAQTTTPIGAFDKGEVQISYVDPTYEPPHYQLESSGERIGNDANSAINAVNAWRQHSTAFAYFVQFKDDRSRRLIRALFDHTELVVTLFDTRLGLDSAMIWNAFDELIRFEAVHSDYRADPNRESRYAEYATKLAKVYEHYSAHVMPTARLIDRAVKQIELKRTQWARLAPIVCSKHENKSVSGITDEAVKRPRGAESGPPRDSAVESDVPLRLFYSYSHNDETFRVELEKHLAVLRRTGVIDAWHFRQIPPGHEWEGEIDQHLEAAQIILLLISPDFLSSNYCWEVEGRRALERHQQKLSAVIPVVLRACDWIHSPFARLQALPTNAKAIASWSDKDEALTDVAAGIRAAAGAFRSRAT
jgi:hypothetical protein